MTAGWRIAAVSLSTVDTGRLAAFYEAAFGFRAAGPALAGAAVARLTGQDGAGGEVLRLQLGAQAIELWAADPPGRPYPADSRSCDLWFQHLAIVTADMRAAYAHLLLQPGWTPITTDGPQRLPERSGGVTAFKFRDPEGHPLELLEFPPGRRPPAWQAAPGGPCLGIDHSAIAVADSAASIAFYAGLGFAPAGGSDNEGPEQARLDGLPDARVQVTALRPAAAPPHLELLGYAAALKPRPRPVGLRQADLAATRLRLIPVASPDGAGETRLLHDPDGHGLVLDGRPLADGPTFPV